MPQFKRYKDELEGLAVGNLWTDIDKIDQVAAERLGPATAQVTIAVENPHADADPVANLSADDEHGWCAMAAVQNVGLALDKARGWLAMSWEELFEGATASNQVLPGSACCPS